MRKSEMSVPVVVATELTPARAMLAKAIDVLDSAQERLAGAQVPLDTLERVSCRIDRAGTVIADPVRGLR
jgi:hypothetical protein